MTKERLDYIIKFAALALAAIGVYSYSNNVGRHGRELDEKRDAHGLLALDTVTGRLCKTIESANTAHDLPLCSNLPFDEDDTRLHVTQDGKPVPLNINSDGKIVERHTQPLFFQRFLPISGDQ